jgi:hypothetical protein
VLSAEGVQPSSLSPQSLALRPSVFTREALGIHLPDFWLGHNPDAIKLARQAHASGSPVEFVLDHTHAIAQGAMDRMRYSEAAFLGKKGRRGRKDRHREIAPAHRGVFPINSDAPEIRLIPPDFVLIGDEPGDGLDNPYLIEHRAEILEAVQRYLKKLDPVESGDSVLPAVNATGTDIGFNPLTNPERKNKSYNVFNQRAWSNFPGDEARKRQHAKGISGSDTGFADNRLKWPESESNQGERVDQERRNVTGSHRKLIGNETRQWTHDLDVLTPIDETSIPGFKRWVSHHTPVSHVLLDWETEESAFDWAIYVNKKNEVIVGLPPNTPVRAIAPGRVLRVSPASEDGYYSFVSLSHGKKGSGLSSTYFHVMPLVRRGDIVSRGQVIGKLYADPPGPEGDLVHLHFELRNGYHTAARNWVDPEQTIYKHVAFLHAQPRGSLDFRITEWRRPPKIVMANFQRLTTEFYDVHQLPDRIRDSLKGIIGEMEDKRVWAIASANLILKDAHAGLSMEDRRRLEEAYLEATRKRLKSPSAAAPRKDINPKTGLAIVSILTLGTSLLSPLLSLAITAVSIPALMILWVNPKWYQDLSRGPMLDLNHLKSSERLKQLTLFARAA